VRAGRPGGGGHPAHGGRAHRGIGAAVCPSGGEPRIALTGGLFALGDPLLVPLEDELARRLPHALRTPAEGDPLDGAVRIAVDLATGAAGLPHEETLLSVLSSV